MKDKKRLALGLRSTTILLFIIIWIGTFSPGKSGKPDLLVTLTPETVTIKKPGTWTVQFKSNVEKISKGASIKCRFVKGFSMPQLENSRLSNFISVQTNSVSGKVDIISIDNTDETTPWDWDRNAWIVTIQVTDGNLIKDETIELIYGAEPPHGQMLAPPSAFSDKILVAYDLNGSGVFQELLDPPVIKIEADVISAMKAYLPSQAITGNTVDLVLTAVDSYYNQASAFPGQIELATTDSTAQLEKTVRMLHGNNGRFILPVTFNKAGIHRISLSALDDSSGEIFEALSNPIRVTAQDILYKTYWGDIHSHSRFSHDGHGTNPFDTARDVARLDFYALTEHSTNDYPGHGGINDTEWKQIKNTVIAYNQPGKFITLLGYEYSQAPPSGHHNIYFNGTNEALADLPLYRRQLSKQIQTFWGELQSRIGAGVEFLTIPHHTGIKWSSTASSEVTFGTGFGDPTFRPLLELYSIHGLSEQYAPNHPLSYDSAGEKRDRSSIDGPHYAQDAWAAGETIGVIGSSDNHSSRPGLEMHGLTAVLAPDLTRENVFRALQERKTYATTGQRMLLSFTIQKKIMGSHVRLGAGEFPDITASVQGTDTLQFIEVLKWDREQDKRQNNHPVFEVICRKEGKSFNLGCILTDSTYTGDSIYYIRAKQKNDIYDIVRDIYRQAWAWSSPIWVNGETPLNVDDANNIPRAIKLKQHYPNPSSGRSELKFYLPRPNRVTIKLYDVLGREVIVLMDKIIPQGHHSAPIITSDLPNGIYFMHIQAGRLTTTRKLLLFR